MKRGRRITIRLDEEELATLRTLCESSGLNVSGAVRAALRATNAPDQDRQATRVAPKPYSLPDRILRRVQKYLAWGRGSLKDEWQRQFDEFYAVTVASKQLYPRLTAIAKCHVHLAEIDREFPRSPDSV
jgi:hypothetical protein